MAKVMNQSDSSWPLPHGKGVTAPNERQRWQQQWIFLTLSTLLQRSAIYNKDGDLPLTVGVLFLSSRLAFRHAVAQQMEECWELARNVVCAGQMGEKTARVRIAQRACWSYVVIVSSLFVLSHLSLSNSIDVDGTFSSALIF